MGTCSQVHLLLSPSAYCVWRYRQEALAGQGPQLTKGHSWQKNMSDLVEIQKKLSKVKKKLDQMLIEELDDMAEADLKSRIVKCVGNIAESESAKEKDTQLQDCKVELKNLAAPYRDAISHQRAILKYVTLLLQAKDA